MSVTPTRYATNDTDLREINVNVETSKSNLSNILGADIQISNNAATLVTNTTHQSLGGYQPETGSLTTLTTLGSNSDYKVDSRGNMNIRGMVITDEGSFRQDFSGTTLYHTLTGTSCTFTNGSRYVTGVATTFNDATFGYADYVKLSTDTDASYARVESITSATTLTLISAYTGIGGTGTGYMSAYTPLTGTGGSFTVGSSIANVVSGTTTASITKLFRAIDFCPLIYVVNASVSQRIANQTAYIGLSDNIASPTISAFFQFDGTNANVVKCVTQSSAAAQDIDSDTITIPIATSTIQRYRIELNQDSVLFTVNDVIIATHKNHITFPYSYMNGVIGWVNGTSPATTSTIAVDNTYIGNIDIVQVGSPALDVIKSNTTVGTTPTNQLYIRPEEFEISCEIVRASNATPYAINQIVQGNGASTLTLVDFTTLGSVASRAIQINSITLLSSNGATATRINPIIHFYSAATLTGQTLTDGTTFNPTYAEEKAKRSVSFESLVQPIQHGSGSYSLIESEIMRNCTLNSSGQLYCAIISGAAYTPLTGESITVIMKGYLL